MTPALRNASVTAKRITRSTSTRDSAHDHTPEPDSWEAFRGVGDPAQRYSLWRLCPCPDCDGTGKQPAGFALRGGTQLQAVTARCLGCRGEGRTLELVATCGTPEAVGVTLVTLGREGEWDDCPVGVMDNQGEKGKRWLLRPWLPSPRNTSDAGRLLQQLQRQRRDIESRVTQERNTP